MTSILQFIQQGPISLATRDELLRQYEAWKAGPEIELIHLNPQIVHDYANAAASLEVDITSLVGDSTKEESFAQLAKINIWNYSILGRDYWRGKMLYMADVLNQDTAATKVAVQAKANQDESERLIAEQANLVAAQDAEREAFFEQNRKLHEEFALGNVQSETSAGGDSKVE